MSESIIEHEKRITLLESSLLSINKRVDMLQKNQEILAEMNGNIKVLAEQNKTQNKKIDKIEVDISCLKEIPGQRWEKLITTIITVVTSGAFGAWLSLIYS